MRVGHWEGDLIKTARDGRRVVVAGRWALQRGQRDPPPRVLVVNSDITERMQGEELLVLQREQLERWPTACSGCEKRIARGLLAICMTRSGRF